MSVDPDLARLLKRLKLGPLLPTLPERLTLARAQQLDYAAFLATSTRKCIERASYVVRCLIATDGCRLVVTTANEGPAYLQRTPLRSCLDQGKLVLSDKRRIEETRAHKEDGNLGFREGAVALFQPD